MFKKVLLLVVFAALLVPFALAQDADTNLKTSRKIVSYIRTWGLGSTTDQINQGNYWRAKDVQADKATTINIAFGLIREIDGEFDIFIRALEQDPNSTTPPFTDFFEQLAELQTLYPDTRFNLSIGGWGADGFSDMALTTETRASFIGNVLRWVEDYDLDGVDIDWEYPVSGAWGTIKSRPEDKQNFTYLMQELRTALDKLALTTDKYYEISFAGAASPAYLTWIEPVKVAEVVDYVKIMSYDLAGPWNNVTGHHANLYNYPINGGQSSLCIDTVVKNYIAAGFPTHKILFGAPFYGRGWSGVGSTDNGIGQSGVGIYRDGITYPDILKLMQDDPSFVRYWDDVAKAPYLYNGDVWITYEDKESLAVKAQYAIDMGLRGFMIWEYAHDMEADLLGFVKQELDILPYWKPATDYVAGDRVNFNDADYICIQSNSSTDAWNPVLAPALWSRIPVKKDASGVLYWTAQTQYQSGDVVELNGVSYKCVQSHVSQPGWAPNNAALDALWIAE